MWAFSPLLSTIGHDYDLLGVEPHTRRVRPGLTACFLHFPIDFLLQSQRRKKDGCNKNEQAPKKEEPISTKRAKKRTPKQLETAETMGI